VSADKKDEMTMRIALFKSDVGSVNVWQLYGKDEDYVPLDSYIRISEWQTIAFKPLNKDAVTGAQLTALTRMRAKVVDEFAAKLSNIDERIANVRSLTGPEVSP
jgi:hypothetical protein